ncbi:MAG TPA: TolC family protein [Gemmatimonadaceae bacterium]
MRRISRTRAMLACAGLSLMTAATQPAMAQGGETAPLTLSQAIEIAYRNGLQARAALSTRNAARSRDRAFDARLLPQFALTGNVPVYSRTIVPVTQPDGTTLFLPVRQTTSDVAMEVTQRVPFTGAELTVRSMLNQVKRSGSAVPETWRSTPFSLEISQPILRPNTIGQERAVNELQWDIAERQYLEAREDIAQLVSSAFFDYFAAQVSLRNAVVNAATNDTLFQLNKGRYEVGKISENDLLQSELALLRAQASQEGARLEHDRAEAALRLALNVGPEVPLHIAVTSDVPDFVADTALAVAQALQNLSSVRTLDLQATQAGRSVSDARLSRLPGASLSASYGYNATGLTRNEVYRDLQQAQRFTLSLQVPLLSWGARSADVQAAQAELSRVQSTSRVAREQARQDAHFAVLQVSLARRQLLIAAKADTVAQKRFEVAYNRYVIGRIDVDQLYLAQNEKDQALLGYVQALRGYWTAHYRLRRVTLWDFEQGQTIR